MSVFWSANKEITKSLKNTLASEKILEKEKMLLMTKVKNQSSQIRITENARIYELAKVAEFGRLSQGLFHDLMTPLSSIILYTEKLKTVPKNKIEGTQKTLGKAIDASKRMASYIQNIRNTIQKKQIDHTTDIYKELQETIDLFSYKAHLENVEILLEKHGSIPWYGDPLKPRQIFSNLISNSIDSFESIPREKKRVIEISLTDKNKEIELVVKDNGCGISLENQREIFNPFFTTKPLDKGTGIGLAMVKSVVENYLHGKITVWSKVRGGTTFIVIFPFSKETIGQTSLL